jgi:hypothetical protein
MLKQELAKYKVHAPLLAAEAMEYHFEIGGSQRRFAETSRASTVSFLIASYGTRIGLEGGEIRDDR